jgi:hypothetical protein
MTQTPAAVLAALRQALDAGAISQAVYNATAAALNAQPAGAVAHGRGAQVVGAGGVAVEGDNAGVINTGVLIQWIEQAAQPGASARDLRRAYLARVFQQTDQLPGTCQ